VRVYSVRADSGTATRVYSPDESCQLCEWSVAEPVGEWRVYAEVRTRSVMHIVPVEAPYENAVEAEKLEKFG
jgi:hypothetical protein